MCSEERLGIGHTSDLPGSCAPVGNAGHSVCPTNPGSRPSWGLSVGFVSLLPALWAFGPYIDLLYVTSGICVKSLVFQFVQGSSLPQ
jgi:hypothetical protein